LHTDSITSSLSFVGNLAGELGVRFLTVIYGKVKMSMEKSSEEEENQARR
jgi:hypothetical protein